jgi:glycosyltransferase involved in cell wall biosynthesis
VTVEPFVSVVVVAYDMDRELPRTIRSLAPDYQRGLEGGDYEVIVVDNGSPRAVDGRLTESFSGNLRVVRIDDAAPSPAAAANVGLSEARGDLVGLIVDGARMASPGLLATARLGARLADRPLVATLGWHLGPDRHMRSEASGYDQRAEDELLDSIDWEHDGYRLFSASTLAGSSGRGWFGPLGESSALFMHKAMWSDLGGLDERFALPGGGLVNHDLYRRACAFEGVQLVVLLGEGTFHQIHGGAATSRQVAREDMFADYETLRGSSYRPPANQPLYLGTVSEHVLAHVEESVRLATKRLAAQRPTRD